MSGKFILVTGNPVSGFRFYGPLAKSEALAYAKGSDAPTFEAVLEDPQGLLPKTTQLKAATPKGWCCRSVAGGWCTQDTREGFLVGPVFNNAPDLWAWQKGKLNAPYTTLLRVYNAMRHLRKWHPEPPIDRVVYEQHGYPTWYAGTSMPMFDERTQMALTNAAEEAMKKTCEPGTTIHWAVLEEMFNTKGARI